MINIQNLINCSTGWMDKKPFPHFYVDNFFDKNHARSLEEEFMEFDNPNWHNYSNAVELKKTCNNWNLFPKLTYKTFAYLNSNYFTRSLGKILFDSDALSSDPGLNGGGWHIHAKGGKLNTHLDYSIHPKLGLQRKINIIIYLNSSWDSSWGGGLGLWAGDKNAPRQLVEVIEPKFNRAAIFDTTLNSWHGLPHPLECPEDQFRKSMAVYYLTSPPENVDSRGKALFAPTDSQKNDKDVLELIKKRSSFLSAESVWKD